MRDNERLITYITASENDTLSESVNNQDLKSVDNLRKIIASIEYLNAVLMSSPQEFSLLTKEGNLIEGKLKMFDSKYI